MTATEAPVTDTALIEVPLGDLHPRPENARGPIDPDSVRALAASIAVDGIEVPLDVTARPDGGWWINAGHRRHAALQLIDTGDVTIPTGSPLDLRGIPCLATERTDAQAALLVLTENLARADLSPIEEARAYANCAGYKITQADMAKAVGRNPKTVSARLKLLQLPDTAQQAIHDRRLTLDVADDLVRIDDPKVVEQLVKDGCPTWAIGQAITEQERRAARKALNQALEQHGLTEVAHDALGMLNDDGKIIARRWTQPGADANNPDYWLAASYDSVDALVAGEPDLKRCAGLTIRSTYGGGWQLQPVYTVDHGTDQARAELTDGWPNDYDPDVNVPTNQVPVGIPVTPDNAAQVDAAEKARREALERERQEEARKRKERVQAIEDLTMAIAKGKTPPKAKVVDALLAEQVEYFDDMLDLGDEGITEVCGAIGIPVPETGVTYGWLGKADLTQPQILKLVAIAIIRSGLGSWYGEPKPHALELAAALGWTDPTAEEGSGADV